MHLATIFIAQIILFPYEEVSYEDELTSLQRSCFSLNKSRELYVKKKRFVRELMYDTHLLTVVQASKWQCLKTFLGKAQNVMVINLGHNCIDLSPVFK